MTSVSVHNPERVNSPPTAASALVVRIWSRMNSAQAWDADRAQSRIDELKELPGAMMPILHALQEEFGYVDAEAVPLIASALNVSRAEVHGVISFYHDFRHTPPGLHTLKMCRAEACQSMGCDKVIRHVEDRLGVKLGETTGDGWFTVDAVYCLGNCALSPAVMLDGKLYGRVSAQVADFLIDDAQRRSGGSRA
jgi:formate dehydrogenase subunit gamma